MDDLIPAFGEVTFNESVTPDYLYRTAMAAPAGELRDAIEEYAATFATIRNLPETPATIRAIL